MNIILNQFFSRIQNAQKARSKDIRLTIEEANQISLEISKLTNRDSDLVNQIQLLLKAQPISAPQSTITTVEPIVFSGGRFTDSNE